MGGGQHVHEAATSLYLAARQGLASGNATILSASEWRTHISAQWNKIRSNDKDNCAKISSNEIQI